MPDIFNQGSDLVRCKGVLESGHQLLSGTILGAVFDGIVDFSWRGLAAPAGLCEIGNLEDLADLTELMAILKGKG